MPAQDQPPAVRLSLSRRDAETLLQLADYHQRSLGRVRHLVRLTSSSAVRARFRYVAEESRLLRLFMEATIADLDKSGQERVSLDFTIRTLVAFWGRLLASLNTKRSRRKLDEEEIIHRQDLSERLGQAALEARRRYGPDFAAELQTRRPVEAEWMIEMLDGPRSAEGPTTAGS